MKGVRGLRPEGTARPQAEEGSGSRGLDCTWEGSEAWGEFCSF